MCMYIISAKWIRSRDHFDIVLHKVPRTNLRVNMNYSSSLPLSGIYNLCNVFFLIPLRNCLPERSCLIQLERQRSLQINIPRADEEVHFT
jgi:hypothetical protein